MADIQAGRPYTIYALIDPRDYTVRYVGVTDDVYARFAQHIRCDGSNPMKDAWIQELKAANMLVVMQHLQVIEGIELAKKREAYWIRHYSDLGMPLTNLTIPICHDNAIVILASNEQQRIQTPKLKARMTLDEQKAYILSLLDLGKSRRQILAKVDGYIHPKVVASVLEECMLQSLIAWNEFFSEKVDEPIEPKKNIPSDPHGEVIHTLQEKMHPPEMPLQQGTAKVQRVKPKEFTPEQEMEFIQRYSKVPDIKKCLGAMGLGIGTYYNCAALVVERRRLRRA